MPQLNIHELEARPDWPMLVTAVPCRTCDAAPGALCCDVGARKLSGQIITRPDYHAERKYDAALAWLHRGDSPIPVSPVTPVSSPPETPATADDTGVNLVDVAELVSDLVDVSAITPAPDPEPPPPELFASGETGGAGAGGSWEQGAPDPYTVSDAPDEPVQDDTPSPEPEPTAEPEVADPPAPDFGGNDHA